MSQIMGKTCLECKHSLQGRIDKKFCSDQCRSAFNNRQNTFQSEHIRKINFILRKNWRILSELNPEGKIRIGKEKLQLKGFDFNYFTSMYTTREGTQYFFCYNQGYLPLDKNFVLLVVKKD